MPERPLPPIENIESTYGITLEILAEISLRMPFVLQETITSISPKDIENEKKRLGKKISLFSDKSMIQVMGNTLELLRAFQSSSTLVSADNVDLLIAHKGLDGIRRWKSDLVPIYGASIAKNASSREKNLYGFLAGFAVGSPEGREAWSNIQTSLRLSA